MAARIPEDERLCDLLTLRAIEGLSEEERKELQELAANHPEFDPDEFDRVAASLALAGLRVEPMPAALRARIEADAKAWFAEAGEPPAVETRPAAGQAVGPGSVVTLPARRPPAATVWGGWLAAAAAMVVAVIGWLQVDSLSRERAALAARQASLEGSVNRLERALAGKEAELAGKEAELAGLQPAAPAALLARLEGLPDTLVLPWAATGDPSATGAGGAVIWSESEQAGLMRIHGLAPNDPAVAQYQLWIFDAGRDDRFPVDGGVFDVPAGGEEALVPIRARLPVGEAVLFAITVEGPGGTVVSSRERIALVAQPGA
jgi:hypothetical protein